MPFIDPSIDQMTPLMIAAMRGDFEAVRNGIACSAAVDETDFKGRTALMFACGFGRTEIARELIRAGADVNAVGTNALLTPIFCAVYFWVKTTPTNFRLFSKGDEPLMRLLIENGANVNSHAPLGNTVLHYAARGNSPSVISLLIESGANINAQTVVGYTPLMYAIAMRNIQNILPLLHAGTDLSLTLFNGRTALEMATRRKRPDIVEILNSKTTT